MLSGQMKRIFTICEALKSRACHGPGAQRKSGHHRFDGIGKGSRNFLSSLYLPEFSFPTLSNPLEGARELQTPRTDREEWHGNELILQVVPS